MKYWLTGDEHYHHRRILEYSNRPFKDIDEMNYKLIENNNLLVKDDDVVIHVGDFSLANKTKTQDIINQLKGNHIFIEGSHDSWAKGMNLRQIWEKKIGDNYIVASHYAMRVWPRSHYGSFLAYGHSHGNLPGVGRSMDVGVDCTGYCPVSLDLFILALKDKPFIFDSPARLG